MTTEELLAQITNPNNMDSTFRVEVRNEGDYWFTDAVEDNPYAGVKPVEFTYYSTFFHDALEGLFGQMQNAGAIR